MGVLVLLLIKYFRILRQSYKIFSSLSSKLTKFKIVLTFNCRLCIVFNKLLLSIAKLQNLKAIHNYKLANLRISQFENYLSCYQSHSYKV